MTSKEAEHFFALEPNRVEVGLTGLIIFYIGFASLIDLYSYY